jgi:hypothetical protein
MSADQYKQIGTVYGEEQGPTHQWRGGFIKQNGNFKKSQELKGQSEKL